MGMSFTVASSGCGTLLHHERVGQPHGNQIDWEVAALNGLGLAFFFVPGVIAFVVDFYNGTIYLPHSSSRVASHRITQASESGTTPVIDAGHSIDSPSQNVSATQTVIDSTRELVIGAAAGTTATLRRLLLIPTEQPTAESVEHQVKEETGLNVSLQDENTRVSLISDLDQFDEQRESHDRDPEFGMQTGLYFQRIAQSFDPRTV